jgi:glyceraldehyde-3-phosphate dehydrogenase/erythrose-4-phosphate dehydrogenase
MAKRIAINGFGRIGRQTFRKLYNMPDVEIVGINDLTDPATLAHLLKYDSAQGTFDKEVRVEGNDLIVEDERIKISAINPLQNFGRIGCRYRPRMHRAIHRPEKASVTFVRWC